MTTKGSSTPKPVPHPPTSPLPSLMTLREVGTYLRLHPETVRRRFVKTGLLPCLRISGRLRFDRAALTAFVNAAPQAWVIETRD